MQSCWCGRSDEVTLLSMNAQSDRQHRCYSHAQPPTPAAAAACDSFHHAPVNTPILIELLASLFWQLGDAPNTAAAAGWLKVSARTARVPLVSTLPTDCPTFPRDGNLSRARSADMHDCHPTDLAFTFNDIASPFYCAEPLKLRQIISTVYGRTIAKYI